MLLKAMTGTVWRHGEKWPVYSQQSIQIRIIKAFLTSKQTAAESTICKTIVKLINLSTYARNASYVVSMAFREYLRQSKQNISVWLVNATALKNFCTERCQHLVTLTLSCVSWNIPPCPNAFNSGLSSILNLLFEYSVILFFWTWLTGSESEHGIS